MDHGGWPQTLWLRLRAALFPRRVDAELDEELEYHIDRQIEEYTARGFSEADARERAIEQLGGLGQVRARCRQAAPPNPFDDWQNWRGIMAIRRIGLINLKWVVPALAVIGAGIGWAIAASTPPEYRSTAVLRVVPPQVSADVVPVPVSRPLDQRLDHLIQVALSRTRLEKIMLERNLYAEARQRSIIMAELIEHMRSKIQIEGSAARGDIVTVSFTGETPESAMRVTEMLAATLRDDSRRDQEEIAMTRVAFLESQVEDAGRRVQQASLKPAGDRRAKLEAEVIESIYTKALTNLEAARVQVNLARRQIGTQMVLLDPARLPERPSNQTRAEVTGIGALAGLAAGLVLAATLAGWRAWRARRPGFAPASI